MPWPLTWNGGMSWYRPTVNTPRSRTRSSVVADARSGVPAKPAAHAAPSQRKQSRRLTGAPRPRCTADDPPRGFGPAWERPGARPGAPRPRCTAGDPPRGFGPAWERPGAWPGAPRPRCTADDPPGGFGPAWERPGAWPG